MKALIQRVSRADVHVDGEQIACIGRGLLVLLAVERNDGPADAARMAERLCGYRVFADGDDKMNLNVRDIGGEILLVPQFTLAADTAKGMRPSFHPAADPAQGRLLFSTVAGHLRDAGVPIGSGRFGADMQVGLINDGPVTFLLQTGGG